MTLNGVMAVMLRYSSEFGYLPGALRKSSRSLSHLLMSSCLMLKCPQQSSKANSGWLTFTMALLCVIGYLS